MNTFLKVTSEQVKRLIDSPTRAVDLVRDLLWTEALRQGINPFSITVSDKVYTPDGGVDGTTIDIAPIKEGLLFKGSTYYQIKWGESFDPRKKSHLKRELLEEDGKLKSKLQTLAQNKGTYVLVWFGDSFVGNQDEICTDAIKEIFRQKGQAKAQIQAYVLDRAKIAQACSQHPFIQSTYFNDLSEYFLTIEQWKQNFPLDRDQKSWEIDTTVFRKADLQAIQRDMSSPPYDPIQFISHDANQRYQLHRWLVYEALRSDGWNQRVMCIDAEHLIPPLSTTLQSRTDLNQVIIIDACKKQHHQRVIDLLGQRTERLGLIVISQDATAVADERFYFYGERGFKDSSFLKHIASKRAQESFVPRSEPSTSQIPEQKRIELSNSIKNVFCRIRQDYGHETANLAKRVLRFMALFSKIGSEINITLELKFVSKKASFASDQDWLSFVELIHIFRKFSLIDGEYYIEISDKDFRHFLIQEWWEIYGSSVDFQAFLKNMFAFSEDLAKRLIDSVPYITSTESGKRIAHAMLGDLGIFSDGRLLRDEFGSQLFGKLTEADPEAALKCLVRTVGSWDVEELRKFASGRREAIWALEKIAMWRPLFIGAAKLLLSLGEAENETWGNNASGVFAQLFSSGYGEVAPTEASPLERFPVLKEAIISNSKERRSLALKACNHALVSDHFIRTIGSEQQGLREKPQLWMPKTYGELFEAYRQVWHLLREQLDNLHEDEQQEAVDILLQHMPGLGRIGNLVDMIMETVSELADKPYIDKRKIIAQVLQILKYEKENLPTEVLERWEQIRDDLTGTDFSSQLRRYVGMSIWETESYNTDERKDQDQERIQELAKRAVEDTDTLRPELPWLMTNEAKQGHRLGSELGKIDKDLSLLPELIEAQKQITENGDIFFLSGYFSAVFNTNEEIWEKHLQEISEDKDLNVWLPELTFRSGASNQASLRVLELAETGIIDICQYRIPIYGGLKIDQKVFKKWICFLLKQSRPCAVYTALDWYYSYYIRKDVKHELPQKLTWDMLTHKLLFVKPEIGQRGQLDDFHWTGIAEKFIEIHPSKALKIAEVMLEHYGEEGTVFGGFRPQANKVLNAITRRQPENIWPVITKYIGPPLDKRAFQVRRWLQSGNMEANKDDRDVVSVFSPERIWEWVDEDVEKRAWYLASFVPKELSREAGKVCLARELLIRYGERKEVRSNLTSNFMRGFMSGRLSENLSNRRKWLLDFKDEEDNENVRQWIDGYVAVLDQQIERWRMEEEREDWG